MTPRDHFRENVAGIEQGYVFSLMPTRSKSIYNKCLLKVTEDLDLSAECTFDVDLSEGPPLLTASLFWGKIQKADIIIADITDFEPQVMCQLGISLSIKNGSKIILMIDKESQSRAMNSPIDLHTLRRLEYDLKDLGQFRQLLYDSLRNALDVGPIPHPLPDLHDRTVIEKAIRETENRSWIIADVLFQAMHDKSPDNWYILMQWGIMYREKSDLSRSKDILDSSLHHAGHDQEKACVYIELALLEHRQKNYTRSEAWFKSARAADRKNRRIYIEWANIYYELGSPEGSIAQIVDLLNENGKDDKGARILLDFYHAKLNDPHSPMGLEEFKKKRLRPKAHKPESDEVAE